ncbi:MAG TPA: hypothetical protein P5052_02505 [Candidatus Paceibacterota bacterium]|jgi:hypothetical protein|nr:hypothetical protein [Candidatus Paceibacterota bacterium]HRZ29607.1 hypothetical protein [Candidatus Paceibacterota bacterium]
MNSPAQQKLKAQIDGNTISIILFSQRLNDNLSNADFISLPLGLNKDNIML